jgi:hypothetical protein
MALTKYALLVMLVITVELKARRNNNSTLGRFAFWLVVKYVICVM